MTMAGFDRANKGIPFAHRDATGWNLFGDDATFPAAVLLESALKGNSASMSDYCLRNGVSLAPHGKTTMSPELFAPAAARRGMGDHRGERASGTSDARQRRPSRPDRERGHRTR